MCYFCSNFAGDLECMTEKLSHIWHSASARNVGKLLSANVFAQALGLLVYPVLTRLYTPEDFGLLSLFCSIGGVLILLASLDWFNAIVLPKTDEEARPVVHISLLAIAALTVLLVLTIPAAGPIASLFNSPALADYYWLLPAYVALMSVWNVLNYWYIRRKAYGRISGYQISQSLFSAGYKAGFGFAGWLSGGLSWASILSPLCSLVLSVSLAAKKHLKPLLSWNRDECKRAAVTYSNFPKYSLPHSLINNLSGQLPVLLLAPAFSVREVGFWGMALLLSYAPISLITRAVYQVLYQQTTEQVNARQPIASFFRRFTGWTLVTVIPFFTLLWFVLPALTQWLLGDEWRVVGEYIRWLLPWLVCNILFTCTNYLFDTFGKQKTGLRFEILLAVLRLSGLCLGIALHSFEAAVAGYAIGSAIGNIAPFIWSWRLVHRYDRSLA